MMRAFFFWLAMLQAPQTPQAGVPPPVEPAAPAVAAPAPEPWTGTLSQGLAELRAVEANAREDVLALAARIGLAARAPGVEPARAARVLHDLGLARAAVDDLGGALGELRAAAGAAGPGAVRESALYAAGTARLLRAEDLRLAVPEIAEALGLPEPPATEEGGPDALDVARQAYLDARADLLERLRVDARHADTRANLELATRRLRELERIQQEREQQEQEQEQEQKPEQDPQQEPQDQPQDQEQEPEDSEQQPEEQPPQEQEGEEQEDEQPPEETPPEPQDAESEPDEQESQPQPQDSQEGEIEERVLSREEVQRLLDQLSEIEEEAKAVRARLIQRRRKPVDKDW
jgi:flagellar biosynthesis GTPase FlhF